MLISTDVISHVKATIEQVDKWSLPLVSAPYNLLSIRGHWHHNFANQAYNKGTLYKFEANANFISSQWLLHLFIFASGVASILFQLVFEQNTFLQICVCSLTLTIFVTYTGFVYTQHRNIKRFVYFLNQLISFEIHHVNRGNLEPGRTADWEQSTDRKVAFYGILLIRVSLQMLSVFIGITSAIFPFAPPRLVPPTLLRSFDYLKCLGQNGTFLIELARRITNGLYSYTIANLFVSHGILITAISFLCSQCCLLLMVAAMKRWDFNY